MANVEELKQQELDKLKGKEEVYDLEQLVLDGTAARFPVKIKLPHQKEDGTFELVEVGALVRPLSNIEWNNAVRIAQNDFTTTVEIELVKMALYTKDGEQMPPRVIESMANGGVIELVNLITEISGIDIEKNMRQARMMGFST